MKSFLIKAFKKIRRTLKYIFIYNTLDYQKKNWEDFLSEEDWSKEGICGHQWGDPNNANDKLGNYGWIRDQLILYATKDKVLLEIGSLGGKWTQYLLNAKKIVCVDINSIGFDYIRKKLPYSNIEFYLSKGDEIKGIADESVDFVFSMDVFPRVPKKFINNYFIESYRVLTQNGQIFFHMPCDSKSECRGRGFVSMNRGGILRMANRAGFQDAYLEENIINHGVICRAHKSLSGSYSL